MQLPARIESLLKKDEELNAVIQSAMVKITSWIKDNKTVFFPEYTEHGISHLEEVLETASSVINDGAWEHLTSTDAAAIITSTLLHDCALHLTEDGFYYLISGNYQSKKSIYTSTEESWPILWQSFLIDSRRYNKDKLIKLFGDDEPLTPFPSNKQNLTRRHYLLAGEFIRKYHARLAHEIALTGIPGALNSISIREDEQARLFDLFGYIARSHNLSLRSAVDNIDIHTRRLHLNCHAPFIMAALRISDYLQIQSSRAPGHTLKFKSLSSPISRTEWKKHDSVLQIHQAHDDPESIYVDCEPESAQIFSAMRTLLTDIQSELDQCWATIGEVYGRFSPTLGLQIRRIRSSIDNPDEFKKAKQPNYIPREFKFRTSSAELMDLLVKPLYGDNPEIGVRELLQNAVDACLEREDLVNRGMEKSTPAPAYDVLIAIEQLADETGIFTIEDFGVGMTEDVVNNYFLNVGASFRNSDYWRSHHETEGRSNIHRTGRFGVGLLAAFLLGERVSVITRHISAKEGEGLQFDCIQSNKIIEVKPATFHHGTKIEIRLKKEITEKFVEMQGYYRLDWDWYCTKNPVVHRTLKLSNGETTTLPQEYTVPECDADLSDTKWSRIQSDGFNDILWTYDAKSYCHPSVIYPSRMTVCNGVFVCSNHAMESSLQISGELNAIRLLMPTMVFYDQDGRLPLNLQRDSLDLKNCSFKKELKTDLSDYITQNIADSFKTSKAGITKALVAKTINPSIQGLHQSDAYDSSHVACIGILPDGVVPMDISLICEIKPKSIIIDATHISQLKGFFNSELAFEAAELYVAADPISKSKRSRIDFLKNSIGTLSANGKDDGYLTQLPIVGRRILLRKSDAQEFFRAGNVPRHTWSRMSEEFEWDQWQLLKSGTTPPRSPNINKYFDELNISGSFGLTIIYLNWDDHKTPPTTALAAKWKEIVGSSYLKLSV